MPAVAPFTGAWVETMFAIVSDIYIVVAPFTGAWVETTRRLIWDYK